MKQKTQKNKTKTVLDTKWTQELSIRTTKSSTLTIRTMSWTKKSTLRKSENKQGKIFQNMFFLIFRSKIFNDDFQFDEEDPFLDPIGLESGLTMVKKKPKKTLTLDEKIKAVLTEDQMKQPVKQQEKAEEMEVDEVRVQNEKVIDQRRFLVKFKSHKSDRTCTFLT